MFSVLVSGFPDKAAAEAWINWYEGSGEQDTSIWLDEALRERRTPGKSITAYTDIEATYPIKWEGETAQLKLNFKVS